MFTGKRTKKHASEKGPIFVGRIDASIPRDDW